MSFARHHDPTPRCIQSLPALAPAAGSSATINCSPTRAAKGCQKRSGAAVDRRCATAESRRSQVARWRCWSARPRRRPRSLAESQKVDLCDISARERSRRGLSSGSSARVCITCPSPLVVKESNAPSRAPRAVLDAERGHISPGWTNGDWWGVVQADASIEDRAPREAAECLPDRAVDEKTWGAWTARSMRTGARSRSTTRCDWR